MIPLAWAVGDKCRVRGVDGVIDSLGPDCASVRVGERMIFCASDELELALRDLSQDEPTGFGCAGDPRSPEDGVPVEVDASSAGAQGGAPLSQEVTPRAAVERTEPDSGIGSVATKDESIAVPSAKPRKRKAPKSPKIARESTNELPKGTDSSEREPPLSETSEYADYAGFVSRKLTRQPSTGLREVPELHTSLFPFQRDLVAWALRRGRAALFADTGLGKTAMQIEWAKHVPGDVLILAPLAVAAQTAREGERLGVSIKVCRDASHVEPGINVTNYDRLHRFDVARFTGVVLDESSIIKHHDAKTLATLLDAFAETPFKLCATATPSPNDYTELGTHAEFLGVCSRTEMLSEYFIHDGGDTSKWRLKGHARVAFWRWMASWAALLRKPSDLGYDDAGYDLPELRVTQHTIPADPEQVKAQGLLFAEPAKTLTERRAARKGSLSARVQRCAEVVLAEPKESWVIWCELNAEADALTEALGASAVEIRGSDEPLLKEGRLVAFGQGEIRILVTKPSIAGFGLNWQHAARMAFVGVKDSWESYYQAIRRCWRFGQRRPVHVHVFASELEGEVVRNLQRKEADALAMAEQLSAETREVVRAEVRGMVRDTNEYAPSVAMAMPNWMKRSA